jgi:hypothetical protein
MPKKKKKKEEEAPKDQVVTGIGILNSDCTLASPASY